MAVRALVTRRRNVGAPAPATRKRFSPPDRGAVAGSALTLPQRPFGQLSAEAQSVRVLDALMAKLAATPAAERNQLRPLFDELERATLDPPSTARAKALEALLVGLGGQL